MHSANPIIEANHLTIRYDSAYAAAANGTLNASQTNGRDPDREPALEEVTVSLFPGDRIALIGPNGAGKSTFIKAVMGLVAPSSGSLRIHADPLQIGYVPQQDDVKWDFPVTVRDVVMMGCARRIGWLRMPTRSHWEVVDSALDQVGMRAYGRSQIGELSGGQRRRVFIARALAQNASLLILDEPFSGVDARAQADLMAVLDHLHADGMTILLSTHDLDLAFRRFDKVMAVRRRLIAYGTPSEVYTDDAMAHLYGSRVVTYHQDGHPMTMYVDNHHCDDC
ncbi:MAG: metal ABC transporter ATP-binding protein [Anaerolineae bacterium]